MGFLINKKPNDLTTYYAHRYDMRTGDCLLWRSSSFLGFLIRIWSKRFNHASLIIQPHSDWKPFNMRRMVLEALEHGVVLRLISERLRCYHGQVWHFPLKDVTGEQRAKIEAWAIEQEGTNYDFGNLFKNALGRVSADAKALFCSEFTFLAWREAGLFDAEAVQNAWVENGLKIDLNTAPRPGDIPALGIFGEPVRIL